MREVPQPERTSADSSREVRRVMDGLVTVKAQLFSANLRKNGRTAKTAGPEIPYFQLISPWITALEKPASSMAALAYRSAKAVPQTVPDPAATLERLGY